MSITYTITTNFGAKDALAAADPDKVIKGSDFTTEFTAIKNAFATAAPAASPTFTGTVNAVTVTASGTVSAATVTASGNVTGANLNIANWDTAYGWGDHGVQGYITSLVEDTTPQLGGTLDANSQDIDMGVNTITDTKVGQWDTAYGWGDHSVGNYAVTTGDTFTGNLTVSAELTADSYNESKSAVTSSSGSLTIDCHDGNVFSLALSENITSTTFDNPPATGTAFGFSLFVTQDSTARTIAWPAAVTWPNASAPTLSATSGDVDIFTFTTFDGGTIWYGIVSGQAL